MADSTLNQTLDRLRHDRDDIQNTITDACRDAGINALLLIGSLGRGGGDSFSDLDLIAVPSPRAEAVDLATVFGDRVLARLNKPRNAPAGGSYTGLCISASGLPLWVDLYTWPAATAAVPTDGVAIYDIVGVPPSDVAFIPLIERHPSLDGSGNIDADVDLLLRVAVAAKYLSRSNLEKLTCQLPAADGIAAIALPAFLLDQLIRLENADLAAAVIATGSLIELAEAQYHARSGAQLNKAAGEQRLGSADARTDGEWRFLIAVQIDSVPVDGSATSRAATPW